MDFFDIVRAYGWNYQALRVSYVLPNVLAHMALPALQAQLLIVVGFYLLGLGGLYTGVRLLWGRMAATVAVACLAYNPIYLLANTAGYVDAALVAYSLCVFGVLAAWGASQRFIWLVIAGIFSTLAILAHTLAAAPVGLIILFFIFLKWSDVVSRPVAFVAGGLVGAALTWTFFVVVLYQIGFGASAFLSLSWIVNASVSGIGANYRIQIVDWLPVTTRLLPGFVNAMLLVVLVVTRAGTEQRRLNVAAMLISCASAALLPTFDLVFDGSVTQSAFYAGLALPGIAISSGAIAAILLPASRKLRLAIAITATAIMAGSCWFAPAIWQALAPKSLNIDLLPLTSFGIVVCLLILTPLRRLAAFPAVMLIVLLSLSGLSLAINKDTRTLYRLENTIDNAEYYLGAVFVRSLINSKALDGREPIFWFDRAEFSTRDGRSAELARHLRFGDAQMALTFYDTLASLRLWDRALFMAELKLGQSIKPTPMLLGKNVTMVVIEQDAAKREAAIRALGQAGIQCRVHDTKTYNSRSFDFNITLIDILDSQERPADTCDR
ncbi:hypothetical protein ACHMW7_14645 [Aminobacter sp. UC22_36]|uniref:hypothetical protein n=1 Tax=Aminobacter sp. UC22_36 TaxID=3374549 RepID=UPI003757DAD3